MHIVSQKDPTIESLNPGHTNAIMMRKRLHYPIIYALALLFAIAAHAQTPNTWSEQYDLPGVNGTIFTSTIAPNGNLIVLGDFNGVQGNPDIRLLGEWDGAQWTGFNIPDGLLTIDGAEYLINSTGPLLAANGSVYVTAFPGVNSTDMFVLRHDRFGWHVLNRSLEYCGHLFFMNGTGLIAFGIDRPDHADLADIHYVVRWNGADWEPIGWEEYDDNPLTSGPIEGTTDNAGNLLVAGGSPNHIARWDGTTWTTVTPDLNGVITAIRSSGVFYYALILGERGLQLYRCNGSQWDHISGDIESRYDIIRSIGHTAVQPYQNGVVKSMLSVDAAGSVYVVAHERPASVDNPAVVLRLNGRQWTELGSFANDIYSINQIPTGGFFVGGSFESVNRSVVAMNLARWHGSTWTSVTNAALSRNGLVGSVAAIEHADGYTYAGGEGLLSVNVQEPGPILRKGDGSEDDWEIVGRRVEGSVASIIAAPGGGIYAGGCFSIPGSSASDNVAYCDGATWQAIGNGPGFCVNDLYSTGSDLYAVGETHLAKWNGSTWQILASDIEGTPYAVAATEDGTVYVGGFFETVANGLVVNHIARWQFGRWTGVGGGVRLINSSHSHPGSPNAEIRDLQFDGENLIAGGAFDEAGRNEAYNIARWDGEAWHDIGVGLTGGSKSTSANWEYPPYVRTIEVLENEIVAGGHFHNAGRSWVENDYHPVGSGLAVWDKRTEIWQPVFTGVDVYPDRAPTVTGVSVDEETIRAGGEFTRAGEENAYRVTELRLDPWSIAEPAIDNSVLHFAATPVGSFTDSTRSVFNPKTSSGAMHAGIAILDGPFEIAGPNESIISPGQRIEFGIRFVPQNTGQHRGTAIIRYTTSNGPDSIIILLDGLGIASSVSMSYPDIVELGPVLQGSSSVEQKDFAIANLAISNRAIRIREGEPGGIFSISAATPSADGLGYRTIQPGKWARFTVSAPVGEAGIYTSTVAIEHDGPDASPIIAQLRLTVLAREAHIETSSQILDFGDVRIGDQKTLPLTIMNPSGSTVPLRVTSDGVGKPFVIPSHYTNIPLQPGTSHDFDVQFVPTEEGIKTTQLELRQIVEGDTAIVSITLRGRGIPGILELSNSPDAIDFGEHPVGSTETRTVSFTNRSTSTLELVLKPKSIAAPFESTARTSYYVTPGETITWEVRFAPTQSGSFNEDLLVEHNIETMPNPIVIPVSGSTPVSGVRGDATTAGEAALSIIPTPVKDLGTLQLYAPAAGDVSIELYSMDGREVTRLLSRRVEAGDHTIKFDASALAPGAYVCRMTLNGHTISRRILVE